MAKRWNERSRKALTEFGTGGKMWKGAGGGGGEELQLPCSVHCVLFFYGRHVSLITSFFIQEYEWSTTAKKGNLKKWNRKNVQLHLSLSSSELRFNNFLIQSHVKLKHTGFYFGFTLACKEYI